MSASTVDHRDRPPGADASPASEAGVGEVRASTPALDHPSHNASVPTGEVTESSSPSVTAAEGFGQPSAAPNLPDGFSGEAERSAATGLSAPQERIDEVCPTCGKPRWSTS